jgi:hypothetical protein
MVWWGVFFGGVPIQKKLGKSLIKKWSDFKSVSLRKVNKYIIKIYNYKVINNSK